MVMKGMIDPDEMNLNTYSFDVVGLIPIRFTAISGLEKELGIIEKPDRTMSTDGAAKPVEFVATIPSHHTAEVLALEAWVKENEHPKSPTAEKPVTLTVSSPTGQKNRRWLLMGTFPFKSSLGDLDMSNDSEMHQIEYTFKANLMQLIT